MFSSSGSSLAVIMESSSSKPRINGTDNAVKVGKGRRIESLDFFLRILAVITTLVAIIVLAVSKQTKTVPLILIPDLPALDVEVMAKWQYSSAIRFFMISNIIACVYATISLIYSILSRIRSKNLGLALPILDLMIMPLLFSANGAAAAVGVIGFKGDSHVRWNKVCNVFGSFCHHSSVSLAISFVGSVAFFLLIVLATWSLYRKSR